MSTYRTSEDYPLLLEVLRAGGAVHAILMATDQDGIIHHGTARLVGGAACVCVGVYTSYPGIEDAKKHADWCKRVGLEWFEFMHE